MSAGVRFLAVDLGASSGRVMACTWDGQRFSLDELHRIPNDGVPMAGELTWNAPGLWKGILDGMSSYRARFNDSPCSVAVDAWGVDFALLDKCGRLVSNPTHYRDTRTLGTPQKVFDKVPEREWFAETGTQTMAINTLFRLCSMVFKGDPRLDVADKLVMIPDLFLHFLCGESGVEFTEATTSHMYSFRSSNWAGNLLERVGVPTGLLPRVVSPGTRLAVVRPDVLRACDLERSSFSAIAVASHDTAAAVASIPEMDEGSVFMLGYMESCRSSSPVSRYLRMRNAPRLHERRCGRWGCTAAEKRNRAVDSAGVPEDLAAFRPELWVGRYGGGCRGGAGPCELLRFQQARVPGAGGHAQRNSDILPRDQSACS